MRLYDADSWTCAWFLSCGWSGLDGGLCRGAVVRFVTRSPLACVRLVACGLLSLLSLTMCFILRSCGMMDFYYWSPYAFHRIAVLGFTVQLGFNVTLLGTYSI